MEEQEVNMEGLAGIMGGGILYMAAGLAFLVIHIISIVKAFQKGSTLWGVLGLLVFPCSTIFLFINKNKGLAIGHIICIILFFVGIALVFGGAITAGGGLEAIMEEAAGAQ